MKISATHSTAGEVLIIKLFQVQTAEGYDFQAVYFDPSGNIDWDYIDHFVVKGELLDSVFGKAREVTMGTKGRHNVKKVSKEKLEKAKKKEDLKKK